LAKESIKMPVSFLDNLRQVAVQASGDFSGWSAWTGVPRETIDYGIIWNSPTRTMEWRAATTDPSGMKGSSNGKGWFSDKNDAWRAAAEDCKRRIDSGDL
jgi:hypothetical protein